MNQEYQSELTSGLKPTYLLTLDGTTEVVPYPKTIYETGSELLTLIGKPTLADGLCLRLSFIQQIKNQQLTMIPVQSAR